MTTDVRHYTIAEYMSLPDDGRHYELVRGELVEMPGPSGRHGRIITKLSRYLDVYLDSKSIGQVFSGSAFVLDSANNTARIPDVAFVKAEKLVGINYDEALPFPPDLAIEVLSPSDIWSEVVEKVRQYLAVGVELVWVVDPFDKNIYLYYPDQSKKTLYSGDELDGENVIPGFNLTAKLLFD